MKFTLSAILMIVLTSGLTNAQTKKKLNPAALATKMSSYVVGLLYKGPAWTAEKTPAVESLQAGHMANIQKMADMGKLVAAGPMGDTGQLRGIFIFRADSVAEVKAMAQADPAINAGRLKID